MTYKNVMHDQTQEGCNNVPETHLGVCYLYKHVSMPVPLGVCSQKNSTTLKCIIHTWMREHLSFSCFFVCSVVMKNTLGISLSVSQ